jgi:hypothetical protein
MGKRFKNPSREAKYPPIEDGDQVAYLLLSARVPSNSLHPRSLAALQAIESAQEAGESLGVKVWSMRLAWRQGGGGEYRYFFRFPGFARDDKRAKEFGECFFFALSLTFGPCLERIEAVVFRVPADLVRGHRCVAIDSLAQVEEARPYADRTLETPMVVLGSSFHTSAAYFDTAWKITPVLVKDERLRRAARYLKASKDAFHAWPGQVWDIMKSPTAKVQTELEQTALENALQNAFKAVEAVLGDPSKDDAKLRARMEAVGLDPDEEVGYIDKASLQTTIRRMSWTRDKKSAHGSTPPRPITAGELVEFQACAQLVVLVAIEHVLGGPIYP